MTDPVTDVGSSAAAGQKSREHLMALKLRMVRSEQDGEGKRQKASRKAGRVATGNVPHPQRDMSERPTGGQLAGNAEWSSKGLDAEVSPSCVSAPTGVSFRCVG